MCFNANYTTYYNVKTGSGVSVVCCAIDLFIIKQKIRVFRQYRSDNRTCHFLLVTIYSIMMKKNWGLGLVP